VKLTMPHFKIAEMMEDKVIVAIFIIMLAVLILGPILIIYF